MGPRTTSTIILAYKALLLSPIFLSGVAYRCCLYFIVDLSSRHHLKINEIWCNSEVPAFDPSDLGFMVYQYYFTHFKPSRLSLQKYHWSYSYLCSLSTELINYHTCKYLLWTKSIDTHIVSAIILKFTAI